VPGAACAPATRDEQHRIASAAVVVGQIHADDATSRRFVECYPRSPASPGQPLDLSPVLLSVGWGHRGRKGHDHGPDAIQAPRRGKARGMRRRWEGLDSHRVCHDRLGAIRFDRSSPWPAEAPSGVLCDVETGTSSCREFACTPAHPPTTDEMNITAVIDFAHCAKRTNSA
jgi:hypothetical protein